MNLPSTLMATAKVHQAQQHRLTGNKPVLRHANTESSLHVAAAKPPEGQQPHSSSNRPELHRAMSLASKLADSSLRCRATLIYVLSASPKACLLRG